MNKILHLAASLLALNLVPAFGQPLPPPMPRRFVPVEASAPAAPQLTKFSLDFAGGTPSQLMEAIQKAMGKSLNVIINKGDEDVEIPPLKMNDVLLPQLFTALEATSRKVVAVSGGNPGFAFNNSYSQFVSGYGFKTDDNPITDTSVWYFHVEKPSLPPVISTQKVCQFYSLSDYLDRGFTVDDITTAIQTGWKLSGETTPPELNYHKETKLLIAYGEPSKLKTIEQVLQALPSEKAVQTRNQQAQMAMQINNLQMKVDRLEKTVSASKASSGAEAQPAEKSGK
jgi:hypothetical protein